jgi:nucleoid DNA-binding protein
MNKAELIDKIVEKTILSKSDTIKKSPPSEPKK